MMRSNGLKHLSPLIAVGLVTILLIGCWMFTRPKKGKLVESWDLPGKTLKFRIEAYCERNTFVGGAYYDFRSAPATSENWQTIMTFRNDDAVPIPQRNVRFVNEQVAYAFIGWKYAITTDAGRTWNVWNAEKDLPGWQCCNYRLIDDVEVRPDGSGKMIMEPIPGRSGELPELHTADFGRHWTP